MANAQKKIAKVAGPKTTPLPRPSALHLTSEPFRHPPPPAVMKVVGAVRGKLLALANKLVPAHIAVFEMTTGIMRTQLLGSVARLGIADLLVDGPMTAEELAAKTHQHSESLHRALRALASMGVFTLRPDGRFENNRLSQALRSGLLNRTREWAMYFSTGSTTSAWCDLDKTLATGQSAFERVQGMTVWEYFDKHPGELEIFAHAMMGFTVSSAPVIAQLYPFSEVQTVCDVGGGRGVMISELLVRHPHLRGILCDAPGVLESAKEVLESRGVTDRVEARPGSFFDPLPKGADLYLVKNVLHNWDDTRCEAILRNCRDAMSPGKRVVVAETVVEKNQTHGFGATSDVQMMMMCSDGKERSRADLVRLVTASGFRAGRVFDTPMMTLVEGVAE